jgi:hypothetical protein
MNTLQEDEALVAPLRLDIKMMGEVRPEIGWTRLNVWRRGQIQRPANRGKAAPEEECSSLLDCSIPLES